MQTSGMKLTRYTDYALRIMAHLAAMPDGLVAIHTLAAACDAPENHVMKVTPTLVRGGFIKSTRGRGGGLRLGRPAEEIRLGDIVRLTESGFDLNDCVDCALVSRCKLKQAIALAGEAYLAVLNQFTLADMLDGDVDSVPLKVANLPPMRLGSLPAPCRAP
jgi:Rrf2 family nitric oxide-sensitive transcriptional repressor